MGKITCFTSSTKNVSHRSDLQLTLKALVTRVVYMAFSATQQDVECAGYLNCWTPLCGCYVGSQSSSMCLVQLYAGGFIRAHCQEHLVHSCS
jgi:hypothetical protein